MSQVAFLFPGQGAQYVGMGKELVERLPAAAELFQRAARVLGYDLLKICLQGPEAALTATDVSQPAIYVASLAALADLETREPDAVTQCVATAGLSLGEYTALTFAGALEFEDGLRIVQARGRAMQAAAQATPSGMLSVLGLELAQVEELCRQASRVGLIQVANRLCPGNIVISGTAAALTQAEQLATELGAIKTIRLSVAGAFHTELMRPADTQLAAALGQAQFRKPRMPIYSNVDGQPHTEPAEIRELLVRQILSPVLWEETLKNLIAAGVTKFFEIGPGRVLAGLLKRVQRKMECVSIAA